MSYAPTGPEQYFLSGRLSRVPRAKIAQPACSAPNNKRFRTTRDFRHFLYRAVKSGLVVYLLMEPPSAA
jgi:hypothetical protein